MITVTPSLAITTATTTSMPAAVIDGAAATVPGLTIAGITSTPVVDGFSTALNTQINLLVQPTTAVSALTTPKPTILVVNATTTPTPVATVTPEVTGTAAPTVTATPTLPQAPVPNGNAQLIAMVTTNTPAPVTPPAFSTTMSASDSEILSNVTDTLKFITAGSKLGDTLPMGQTVQLPTVNSATPLTQQSVQSAVQQAVTNTPAAVLLQQVTPVQTPISGVQTELQIPTQTAVKVPTPVIATQTAQVQTSVVATQTTQVQMPIVPTQTAQVQTPVATQTTQVQMPIVPTQTAQVQTPVATQTTQVQTHIATQTAQVPTPVATQTTQVPTPVATQTTQVQTPIAAQTAQVQTPVIATQTAQVQTPIAAQTAQVQTPIAAQTAQVQTPVIAAQTAQVQTPVIAAQTAQVQTPVIATQTAQVQTSVVPTQTAQVPTPVETQTTPVETQTTPVATQTTQVQTSVVLTQTAQVPTPVATQTAQIQTPVATQTTQVPTTTVSKKETATIKTDSAPVEPSLSTETATLLITPNVDVNVAVTDSTAPTISKSETKKTEKQDAPIVVAQQVQSEIVIPIVTAQSAPVDVEVQQATFETANQTVTADEKQTLTPAKNLLMDAIANRNTSGDAANGNNNTPSNSASQNGGLLNPPTDNKQSALDTKTFASLLTTEKSDALSGAATTPTIDKSAPQNISAAVDKLVQSTKAEVPAMTRPLSHPAWNQEMGERIVWMNNQGISSAEIKMNPQNMGPITVRIDMNQDQATIAFTAQNSEVRTALENSIPKLREMLTLQNVNLAEVNVSQQTSTNTSADSSRSQQQAAQMAADASANGQGNRQNNPDVEVDGQGNPIRQVNGNGEEITVDDFANGHILETNGANGLLSLFA